MVVSTRVALVTLGLLAVQASPRSAPAGDETYPLNYVAGTLVRLNDNGAWSWFMDPRAIVDEGKLIAGSVRAVGSNAANLSDLFGPILATVTVGMAVSLANIPIMSQLAVATPCPGVSSH